MAAGDGQENYSLMDYISPRRHSVMYSYQTWEQNNSLTTAFTASSSSSSGAETGPAAGDGEYQVSILEVIPSPKSCYQVLELIGHGTFGQVLRCWKKDSNEVVAMKILKNLPSYAKQGQVEVEILSALGKVDSEQFNFVYAYESFIHSGHICIVFELLHTNLYDYLKHHQFQPLPLKHIRPIAQQVLTCLKKLKELGVVHADLKPENIMLVDPERQPFRVKVIDFGSATSPSTRLSTTYLQSRYYRAPEVILGVPYDTAIDMWSLGCVLAELFLGWPLFPGATEYDQIMYISQMLGDPPVALTKNVTKMCRFFKRDHLSGKWRLKPHALIQLETGISPKETRKFIFTSVGSIGQVTSHNSYSQCDRMEVQDLDRIQFLFLLEMLLTLDPRDRADPSSCLRHPFITMLHLSGHTTSQCVREWIQCMQICCQLQTTHSTSSLPISSHQHSLIPMPSTYRIDSATYTSCHHSVIQCPPTHWQLTKDHYGLPSFSHLLDTGYMPSTKHHYILPTSSHLVDIGYVSAESSPTGHHHTMDCGKVNLFQQTLPPALLLPQHSSYLVMLQQSNYLMNRSRL